MHDNNSATDTIPTDKEAEPVNPLQMSGKVVNFEPKLLVGFVIGFTAGIMLLKKMNL